MKVIYILHETNHATKLKLDNNLVQFCKSKCPVKGYKKWRKMRRIPHKSIASFHGRVLREILR